MTEEEARLSHQDVAPLARWRRTTARKSSDE
jgi:hypothetical protein